MIFGIKYLTKLDMPLNEHFFLHDYCLWSDLAYSSENIFLHLQTKTNPIGS